MGLKGETVCEKKYTKKKKYEFACIFLLKEKGIYTTLYPFRREKEEGQFPFL